MDVYEAVRSRRPAREFTDQPVARAVLERVLSATAWSPSESNLQPWRILVLSSAPLAELKRLAVGRVTAGDPWDEREFEMYRRTLKSPYRERRSAFGKERYGALGLGPIPPPVSKDRVGAQSTGRSPVRGTPSA